MVCSQTTIRQADHVTNLQEVTAMGSRPLHNNRQALAKDHECIHDAC